MQDVHAQEHALGEIKVAHGAPAQGVEEHGAGLDVQEISLDDLPESMLLPAAPWLRERITVSLQAGWP